MNARNAIRRRSRRRRGFAMMMVLTLVAVATVLGLSYLAASTVKLTLTQNVIRAARVQYLVESALQHGLWQLRAAPEALVGSVSNPLGPFQADETNDSYYFYAEPVAGQALTYTITAYAEVDGVRRQASMTVRFTPTYHDRVAALGPMAYWRLGESWGITARDSAGSNDGRYCNGVDQGETGSLPHDNDKAAEFDGNNDYVDLGNMDIDAGQLTILASFRANSWDHQDGRIISKADGASGNDHYWMLSTTRHGGEQRLRFGLKCNGGTKKLIADSGDIPLHQWVFAAAVYDGSRMILYQSGRSVGERNQSGHIRQAPAVTAWIGGNPDGDTSQPWDGRIDDVVVFTRALSGEEVEALFKARLPEVEVLSWQEGVRE